MRDCMISLIWMIGFYVIGASIERLNMKSVAAILIVAALDIACRVFMRIQQAMEHGTQFAWPAHKIVGSWLAFSAFAGFFLLLGRWKRSASVRREAELRRR